MQHSLVAVQNGYHLRVLLPVVGVQGDAEWRADGGGEGRQGPGPPRSGAARPPHAISFVRRPKLVAAVMPHHLFSSSFLISMGFFGTDMILREPLLDKPCSGCCRSVSLCCVTSLLSTLSNMISCNSPNIAVCDNWRTVYHIILSIAPRRTSSAGRWPSCAPAATATSYSSRAPPCSSPSSWRCALPPPALLPAACLPAPALARLALNDIMVL